MKIIQSTPCEDKTVVRVLVDMSINEDEEFERKLKEGYEWCICDETEKKHHNDLECSKCGKVILPF